VVANFAIDVFTVTSSVGTPAGNISPLGGQSVDSGSTTQFTLTPDTNYHIASVGGTCGGSLVANTFTTAAITADCTVVANFAIDTDTYTVTSSVGTPAGNISPLGGQTVDSGETAQFTLTPDTNYHIDSVGGTCGGSLVANTYTTVAITTDCTVVANFAIDTFTVTSSVGTAAGNISPLGGQSIDFNTTAQFTLTPDTNYHIDSVGGTCGGSLVNNTYTTAAITADCTVVANFAIDTYTVTSSVGTPAGSISPLGGQTVDSGTTTQFTLTPDTDHHIASVGGTCGGSLVGNTYTTTAITADCTVVANFAIDTDTYTVTSSVGTPSGNISPLGGQSVDSGETTQFTLTPDPNFQIDSVGGTCGGTLVGNTYTTAAITADCTVVANFTVSTDRIFMDGFE
jgi:peptidyl-tRNA hydrolase